MQIYAGFTGELLQQFVIGLYNFWIKPDPGILTFVCLNF
jgi:hypothetical protein